jgi:hypothetical protein
MGRRLSSLLTAALFALAPVAPRAAELMTIEAYGKVTHVYPYILEFSVPPGALLYFGAAHSNDPAGAQVARIEALWKSFRPTLAFNEGGDPPALPDARDAVLRFAEAGLVRHLGARDGVPVRNLEPPLAEEARALRERFSEERIKVFYALRQAAQYRRQKNDTTVEEFMDFVLQFYLARQAGLEGPPRNVAELGRSAAAMFPTLPDWRKVPAEWFDPTRSHYFTNEVARDSLRFRDGHIVRLLEREVRRGERVLAVIGGTHVVMQEPVLSEALGTPVRPPGRE